MAGISEKALKLILKFEGLDQPGEWPGGQSGVTIGIGYDLGHVTGAQLEADWREHLTASQIARLKTAIGLTGERAKIAAPSFADIRIKRADAEKVLVEKTIPLHQGIARRLYPGLDRLPPDAEGAIVSLVFNRGDSMAGDRRREMRAIKPAVAAGDLREIARQIRLMKRLWEGQNLGGLLKRRDAEANLIESAIG